MALNPCSSGPLAEKRRYRSVFDASCVVGSQIERDDDDVVDSFFSENVRDDVSPGVHHGYAPDVPVGLDEFHDAFFVLLRIEHGKRCFPRDSVRRPIGPVSL